MVNDMRLSTKQYPTNCSMCYDILRSITGLVG